MSDFTPGPWKAVDWLGIRIVPADAYGSARSDGPIADVLILNGEANARLIAASPELYEALKNLVSEIIKMGDSGWYNEEGGFVKIAQAALALVDKETT